MVDILLIQPPVADFYLTAKRTVPYGLAAIAAAARQRGYSVGILDALATAKSRVVEPPAAMDHLEPFYGRWDRSPFCLFHHYRRYGYSLAHIGRQIAASGAWLVGVASLFTAYSDMALAVARTAKRSLPHCTVVLGGHHPTALPEAVMAEPCVDVVLRGEGEVALPELADALTEGRDPAAVPGAVVRRPDGSLHIGQPALAGSLADLPVPAHDLIRRTFYQRGGRDSIVVTASRGCPLNCSYCATGRDSWMAYRQRPVDAVLDEIRYAARNRVVGLIDFEDENLTMDRRWFIDLMAGVVDAFPAPRPELRAMNGLLPPTLSEPVVRAMVHGGFKVLNLSLGTANADQSKRFRRPDVREAFDRAVERGCRYGLAAVGYVIVGAPDQDPSSSVDDLLFLARRPVLAGVSVFYPAPGSVDYARCGASGLLPADHAAMRASALPIDQRTSRTDAATLLRLGRIVNFMKGLKATGAALPRPAPPERRLAADLDRREVGLRLLAAFLYDGGIRGVDADGVVYDHRVSTALCRRFLAGVTHGVRAA